MLFCKNKQLNLGRREMVQLFLVVVAVVAAFGWTWVLERSLKNERDAWENRFREEKEEQLRLALDSVKEQMVSEQKECSEILRKDSSLQAICSLLEKYSVTAILVEEPHYRLVPDEGKSKSELIKGGVVQWSSDEEGRDELAARLVVDSGDEQIWEMLLPRLSGDEGPPMKPSFRHWLIEEAKKIRGSVAPELEALSFSESVRAAGEFPYRGIQDDREEGGLWWSEETLLSLFDERGVAVKMGVSGQNLGLWGTSWKVRLDMSREEWKGADEIFGKPRLFVVGALCCVILVLALSYAIWMSDRDHRLASLRTDLAASVAHELRTPLAGQRVLLESLERGLKQSAEEREEYLGMALRENQRLSTLAEQFLTFSRLERGKLALEGEEVDVGVLVDDVLRGWNEKLDEVSIEVVDGLSAHLDQDAVTTILRNLLENAWKYTNDFKQIVVRADKAEGGLRFIVEDNGSGLTKKDKEKVFGKFWRAEQMLSRKSEGLGLGLFIVKNLAQAHGGGVKVEDSQLGGAKFEITLGELT